MMMMMMEVEEEDEQQQPGTYLIMSAILNRTLSSWCSFCVVVVPVGVLIVPVSTHKSSGAWTSDPVIR